MAECKQVTRTHKFVVLSVKEGVGFALLKNNVVRILAVFEDSVLSSEPMYITPTPFFNCNFIWRVENEFLKRLQSRRKDFIIELRITEHKKKERPAGYATITLRQAQYITGSFDSPRYRSLELKGVRRSFGVRNPYLFVSLTIQRQLFNIVATEECHNAELEDPQYDSARSAFSGNICDSVNQEDCGSKSQTSIKKALGKNVQKESPLVKKESIKQTESQGTRTAASSGDTAATSGLSTDINSQASGVQRKSSLKTAPSTSKSTATTTKSRYDKSTAVPTSYEDTTPTSQLRFETTSEPTSFETGWTDRTTATSAVMTTYTSESNSERYYGRFIIRDIPKNKNYDNINLRREKPVIQQPLLQETKAKTPTAPTYLLKEHEDKKSRNYHIYKLELQFKSAEWFRQLVHRKITIKFYNPHSNNKVTVKNGDYYLPNLLISNIICCMYYLTLPEELLEMVMYQPPQILFYKEGNVLIARGTLNVTSLEKQSQSEIFETYIPITEKTNATIGEVRVLIKFEDLGVAAKTIKPKCLECVVKYKEPPSNETAVPNTSAEDVVCDVEQLSVIHEQLRQTYKKINTDFEKILKAQGLEPIAEDKQTAQNKETKQSLEKDTATSRGEGCIHNKLASQNVKATTSTADVDPHEAKTKDVVSNQNIGETVTGANTNENLPNQNVGETFTEFVKKNENVVWCDFCKQYHLIRKTRDYITAIETTVPEQLKNKEVEQEVKFANTNKQNIPKESGATRKLADNQSKKESHTKPYLQHESDPKQQIQPGKESKHGNARSVKAASVQTVKPILQSKPRQMAYIPKPSITVIKRPCQGCEQYLEVGYGQRVWQDETLTFWCKDCCIRKLQSDIKDTMQTCTSEVSALKDQIKTLEDEYADYTANSVTKSKYDFLTAAQHNLTMLFIHAKHQNEYLHTQCAKTAEKLEELKRIVPQESPLFTMTQNQNEFYKNKEQMKEIYDRVRELKQEIDNYRNKDNSPKPTTDDTKAMVAASMKPIKRSEQKLSSRKDRCEACRILHNQAKAAEIKKSKTSQPSVNPQIKFVTKECILKKAEKTKEKAPAPPSNFCEHDIRRRMTAVHVKLQHYLEERDELVRVNRYTCENVVVSYMTKIINRLLVEWNELKAELEICNR